MDYNKMNLREAMLLHKDFSIQLANYCQAAAHVLRMAQPKVSSNSSPFPDDVSVKYDYQTLRLLAGIRSNARALLKAHDSCAAAFDVASDECVCAQAQLSEIMESLKANYKQSA